MAWRRLAITLLCVFSLLGLLAYGFSRDPRYIPSPLIGRPAPPFNLALFDGKTVGLEALKGKVVFINFWASWCPPCLEEARELETIWKDLKESDVVFLGVNIQDKEPEARAFIQQFGISYSNGQDPAGRIAVDYGVWGIPETFFIDPGGTITYKHVGVLDRSLVMAKLDEARRRVVSTQEGKGTYQAIR